MWEQIRANRIRSALLITAMAFILLVLGYAIGFSFAPPDGGAIGVLIALFLWIVLWLTAAAGGRQILLSSINAQEISKDDAPQLFNVVEEMTIAAGLPKMPKIYLIDNDAPNAFAAGKPEKSAVAVTSGLMIRLNRDELQGVIAHEIGHIKNHDTRFMTTAGVMVAVIVLLSHGFLRTFFFAGSSQRRSSRSRGGGGGAGGIYIAILLVTILFAIFAPLMAQLLYFASSRKREYLADASAARFTRYPDGLASALDKISGAASSGSWKVDRAHAAMFTVNPLNASGGSGLFSTHPPTSRRTKVLRQMAGAGFVDYDRAYRQVEKGHAIGKKTLTADKSVQKRAPSAEPDKSGLEKARETVNILHRIAGMLFLDCICGLRIKVPYGYMQDHIFCPRCRHRLIVPAVELTEKAQEKTAGDGEKSKTPEAPLTYKFKPGIWQSFRCACGHTFNLSPNFSGTRLKCSHCNRLTEITR